MLKRINAVLPELIWGILIYGIVIQLAGVWFVSDKLRYSSGLWIGIALAVGMAIHMAVVLNDAADIAAEEAARKRVIFQSTLRYAMVVILFFLVAYFKLGDLVTLFFGVMGLKAGAYLQPLTHKVILKLTGRSDASLSEKNNEDRR
jgi:hypothetical protein